MKFSLQKILRVLIPVVLLGIIGNVVFTAYSSRENLLEVIQRFNSAYFFAGILLTFLPWLGHILRLKIWGPFIGNPLSNRDCLRIAIAQDLGGAVTPTVIGGTPIKYGLLVKKGFSHANAGIMITLQFLEDLVFLNLSLPIAFIAMGGFENTLVKGIYEDIKSHWLLIAAIVSIGVMLIFLAKKLYKNYRNESAPSKESKLKLGFREFIETLKFVLSRGKLRFLISSTIMILEWSSRFAIPIVLASAMGILVDPFEIFFLHWLIWFSMLFTPTPGATGGAEGIFYYLFINFIPENLIGILITGWRFLSYYLLTLTGAVVLQVIGVVDRD
ncbi:MAG: flippase-like domain-containing protein [Cyclobacteriaceae bacterium]